MQVLPTSPRARRRLRLLAVLALIPAVIVALLIAFVPTGYRIPEYFSNNPVQVVRTPRQVPLTAADRRAIDRTLDQFVPAALGRRHPLRAWALAAPELRRGTTRAEWAKGELPVLAYPVRAGPTHDFFLLSSIRDVVELDLGVSPAPHADVGNASYFVTLRREQGRWLVSAIELHTVYPR